MKILKWLLGLLALLVIVAVGGGMALSPRFLVERDITIAAPPDRVYPLIADPREWKRWSAWNRRDPAMAIVYSGPPSGSGATWEWKSASQGDGRMRFTAAEAPSRVDYDLYFPDFDTTSTGEIRLRSEGGGTRVTWLMRGDMGRNPLYHWMSLFADRMVGEDFESGLKALKAVAEGTAPDAVKAP